MLENVEYNEKKEVGISSVSTTVKIKNFLFYALSRLAWMLVGYIFFSFLPIGVIGKKVVDLVQSIDQSILIYIAGGFVSQLIDGALGMAYGVSATSFLMFFGISPVAASASVHASEIFTSGVSGLSHLKFGNVNKKLFRSLLIPGVLGAIFGAYIMSNLNQYSHYIRPFIAIYTLYLGVRILLKIVKNNTTKKPVKLGWLAGFGGFMDAIGGGGWGPIVSSTLISSGRHPIYTIGSVNLTEFFVSFASSVTFILFLGFNHWQIILGLILGGVVAAPLAAYMVSKIPMRPMFIFVGILVIIISLRNVIVGFSSWGG